jgi:type IV secretory pathway VirJ component
VKKNVVMLPKVDKLSRDWYVLNGVQDVVCVPAEMHKFLDDMENAHFVEAPGTGHGFTRPARWTPMFDAAADKLLASATALSQPKAPTAPAAAGSAAALESRLEGLHLPLEYVWASRTRAVLVFVSGDGNWAAIDDHLAQYLAARDVSVVGLKARSYFWNERSPSQAGADLARIVNVVSDLHVPIFAGGYSFGGEVVPFMLDTWTEPERSRVSGQILIAAGETASFEVHLLDLVMRAKDTPRRVADAVKRLHMPTACLSGTLEEPRDTVCDDLGASAEWVRLPGSHHFNGKYDDVGAAVLAFMNKHMK